MAVNHDGYYFIIVTWKNGFKHKVHCRGYNLKLQLAFNESLFWVERHSFYEVSQQEYEEYVWGSGSAVVIEKTTSEDITRSPRKNGKSVKMDGKKPSPTKQSVIPVTKSIKKKVPSSTPKKKR